MTSYVSSLALRMRGKSRAKRGFDVVIVAPYHELTEEERNDPDMKQERETEIERIYAGRREMVGKMKAVDLDVVAFTYPLTKDDPETKQVQYILVGASEELLKKAAEDIGLEKKIKEESKPKGKGLERTEIYEEYVQGHEARFQTDEHGEGFFTSLERLQLIFHLIEGARYESPPCASVDLDLLVTGKVIDSYFALEDASRLEELGSSWIFASPWVAPPVNKIRDYLGEKIALYFAWMNLYTNYLGTLGVISLVPVIYGLMFHADRHYDNVLIPIYGMVAVVWAQLFIEHWKRMENAYQFVWNTEDFEDEESLRPEFRKRVRAMIDAHEKSHGEGEETCTAPVWASMELGRWRRTGFIPVSEEDKELKQYVQAGHVTKVEYFSERATRARLLVSTLVTLSIVIFILVVSTLILGMRAYVQTISLTGNGGGASDADAVMSTEDMTNDTDTVDLGTAAASGADEGDDGLMSKENLTNQIHIYAPAIAATVNAIFITIMSYIWSYVGVWLNDYEMHRTDTEWEDSFIWKSFAFQFINSYITTIYIAFVQPLGIKIPLIKGTHGEDLYDSCVINSGTGRHDCFLATFTQASFLILFQQLQRFLRVLIPAAQMAWKRCRSGVETSDWTLQDKVVKQAMKPTFAGTYHEYLEMAIQFGWVCMFAVAFPLGSLFCFFTNIMEKRADAYKVAIVMRRPRYLGAMDIGSIMDVLELLASASIVTNFIILLLSSRAYLDYFSFLPKMVPSLTEDFETAEDVGPVFLGGSSRFYTLVLTIFLEHLVVIAKNFVSWSVPDVPRWVLRARALVTMREEAITLTPEAMKRRDEFLKRVKGASSMAAEFEKDDELKDDDPIL